MNKIEIMMPDEKFRVEIAKVIQAYERLAAHHKKYADSYFKTFKATPEELASRDFEAASRNGLIGNLYQRFVWDLAVAHSNSGLEICEL
jgi:hypothetical protein